MNATTREILKDEMVREWTMAWAGVPGLRPESYKFEGSASEAVDDFRRRFPFVPVTTEKLVMDDGDWTIRLTFADNSVAIVFAS
jgi:hypothetical protein